MKMPEPMMPPMTSIVASNAPRRRANGAFASAIRAYGRDDLVPAAAVLERVEAEVAGHQNPAAVRVEGAGGVDVEVALPLEAVAAVADGEADLAVDALEAHLGSARGVLRHAEAPLHFRLPQRVRAQLRLLLVRDAEVSVLDGVDEELHEADDGGLGVGRGAREDGAEVARFVDRAEGEDRRLHESERLRA